MNGQIYESFEEVRVHARPPQKPCLGRARSGFVSFARDGGHRPASAGVTRTLAMLAIVAAAAASARADEDTKPSSTEDKPAVESVEGGALAGEEAVDDAVLAEGETGGEPGGEIGEAADEEAAEAAAVEGAEGAGDEIPDPDAFDLTSAVDDMLANVHGSVSVEYRYRSDKSNTDQDLYSWLDLRFGDENRDRLSATFFARATGDLDGQRKDRREYEFTSIEDKYDSSWNTRLYSAYLTYRPKDGPVAMGRFGRQYVYAVETFHVDGVYAESVVLEESTKLTANVYGGVPVHLYESSPSNDWMVGTAISAEPFRWTRATLDYVHVDDHFEGTAHDDLSSLRVWQRATPWLSLYGQATYLHGLRDAEARATASFEEQDLMVQASFFTQLKDTEEQFSTEFDPYYAVLYTLTKYDQYKLRAVKGFGDDILVEVGVDVRDAEDSATYNRDVHRYYAMPTFVDPLWDDSEISLIAEAWSGDGDRVQTYGGELTQTLTEKIEASIGSEYSMYGYDSYRDRERNHVRSVFCELRWEITESLDMRMRYVHEEDDEERYDVATLGLTLAF